MSAEEIFHYIYARERKGMSSEAALKFVKARKPQLLFRQLLGFFTQWAVIRVSVRSAPSC
jgi:hypothetical protein